MRKATVKSSRSQILRLAVKLMEQLCAITKTACLMKRPRSSFIETCNTIRVRLAARTAKLKEVDLARAKLCKHKLRA